MIGGPKASRSALFVAMTLAAICIESDARGEPEAKIVAFDAGPLRLELANTGRFRSIADQARRREYLVAGQFAPLLTLTVNGKTLAPASLAFDPAQRRIRLGFRPGRASATIQVAVKPTHVTFTLVAVEAVVPKRIDWGPLPTTIDKTVGETVGVVRDERFALGIQSLNIQTIGLADKKPYGSLLLAYAIEHDGGVRGSKIAIFGCPAKDALTTIGQIEVAEGLPHPMLDGVWGKISPTAKLSYLIAPYGEKTLDDVCRYAERAGLKYVYHPGPFATWGHFVLNPQEFAEGDASLKRCVDRAARRDIRLGVHTLTGFITPNDRYVTPVPDPRLARSGSSTLGAAVDAKAAEIPFADPEPFRKRVPWDKPMNTAILGKELVQFHAVSEKSPWKLTGCTRGAFGTTPAAHAAGSDIGHLADHAYRTFYPGIENGMMDEMAGRLVELGNRTGLRQISFDGLEGLSAYGYGEYARNRFVKECYDGWRPEVISDASNLLHYLWHVHTRMNWGEPWGKAMREGMAEYRFNNQAYFERNLFPRMLGWFELRAASADLEATTLDDMEWMLAKAAGYDAGFAVVSDLAALRANGQTSEILEAVRLWESARLSGAFSAGQREVLRGPGEFHLRRDAGGRWHLDRVAFSPALSSSAGDRGSEEAQWTVANPFGEQPMRFVLRVLPVSKGAADGRIANPSIEVRGRRLVFPIELRARQYLRISESGEAVVCDANWNVLQKVLLDAPLPRLPAGQQTVRFRCDVRGAPEVRVQVRFRTETPCSKK